MENKKPAAIEKSLMYMGSLRQYVLGFRTEEKVYVVTDGKEEHEYDSVFTAVAEVLNKCGYDVVSKNQKL